MAAIASESSRLPPVDPQRRGEGCPSIHLSVRNYDLDATLNSGQAFRWQRERPERGRLGHRSQDHAGEPPALFCPWIGVIGKHQVRLTPTHDGILAETAGPVTDWQWLHHYLQTGVDLDAVLMTFPDDAPMRHAVAACRGLRVLRQDPWECLASFILSSTKQIVQIRQIIALLCERFGEPVLPAKAGRAIPCPPPDEISTAIQKQSQGAHGATRPASHAAEGKMHSFPTAERLAGATEADLRACKMGFRAPHLLAAARQIAAGKPDLDRLRHLPLAEARGELTALRGVGAKIADCVLLFAYGFDGAFPVDVWVARALRELYFPRRQVGDQALRQFAATHFGPHAGYAQQYLFHFMRIKMK
jgi:N-glycosylase/DNA lyase